MRTESTYCMYMYYDWHFSHECIGASHPTQACNHEKVDTKILIHSQDALYNGTATFLVQTVETDESVIIADKFYDLLQLHTSNADMYKFSN